MQPVTTGGKNCRNRPITGASNSVITPAPMMAPHTPWKPSDGSVPIAITGPTELNATPCMIGSRTPNFQKPTVCSSVAMPEVNSAVLISSVVCAAVIFNAAATIIGTVIAPR